MGRFEVEDVALRGRASALGADAGALPEEVERDREHAHLHAVVRELGGCKTDTDGDSRR